MPWMCLERDSGSFPVRSHPKAAANLGSAGKNLAPKALSILPKFPNCEPKGKLREQLGGNSRDDGQEPPGHTTGIFWDVGELWGWNPGWNTGWNIPWDTGACLG